MIVSRGQQKDSPIHTHTSYSPKLLFHPGCHITLSRISCAKQQVFVGYPSGIQQCVPVHPKLPSYPFPLATISSFSKSVNLCFVSNELPDNKLWKILKEMGIPEHLTCLLRNPYAGQEAAVRTVYETANWFQIRKGVHQHYILSPCLFNLYAE